MNKQTDIKQALFTGQGILAAGIAIGLCFLGLGIAIFGLSSCYARSDEAYLNAQVINNQNQLEFYKWKLENGYITEEESKAKNESPLPGLLEN